jgi:putative MATE family efflux protein
MAIRFRQLHKQIDKKISSKVMKLATPVILSNISRTMMSFVDVMMVGHLGSKALAATGMGSMVVWTIISFSIGLRTATQTVSSRRLGQKKYNECGVALRNGILLSFCYGLPVSVLGYVFTNHIAQALLTDIQVITFTRDYISIAFLGVLFSSTCFVFQGFYTGVEKTKIHMKVTITSNMLNIYLNAGFIYGSVGVESFFNNLNLPFLSHAWTVFNFPALGVKGAAVATVIASIFMMLFYFIMLFDKEIKNTFDVFSRHLNRATLFRQIKLATPQGAQELFTMSGYVLLYKIVGIIGIIELAAAGIGQACATLVGKHMGEKKIEKAELSIHESTRLSLFVMGSVGFLFIIIPETIINLFTSEKEVVYFGVVALRLAGFLQIIDSIGMTLWFALSGAGNTFYPSVVETLLVWLYFLPGSYYFGVILNYGFIAPWLFFGSYLLFFAIAMVWKIKQGDWKKLNV